MDNEEAPRAVFGAQYQGFEVARDNIEARNEGRGAVQIVTEGVQEEGAANNNRRQEEDDAITKFISDRALTYVAQIILSSPNQQLPMDQIMHNLWERFGGSPLTLNVRRRIRGTICGARIPESWQTNGGIASEVLARARNHIIYRPDDDTGFTVWRPENNRFAVNPKIDRNWIMRRREKTMSTPSSSGTIHEAYPSLPHSQNSGPRIPSHTGMNNIELGNSVSHPSVSQGQDPEALVPSPSDEDVEMDLPISSVPSWRSINHHIANRPQPVRPIANNNDQEPEKEELIDYNQPEILEVETPAQRNARRNREQQAGRADLTGAYWTPGAHDARNVLYSYF